MASLSRRRDWLLVGLAAAVIAWTQFSDWSPLRGWVQRTLVASARSYDRLRARSPCPDADDLTVELGGVRIRYPACYTRSNVVGSVGVSDRIETLTLIGPRDRSGLIVTVFVIRPERPDPPGSLMSRRFGCDGEFVEESGWQVRRCEGDERESVQLLGHLRWIVVEPVLLHHLRDTPLATFVREMRDEIVADIVSQTPEPPHPALEDQADEAE